MDITYNEIIHLSHLSFSQESTNNNTQSGFMFSNCIQIMYWKCENFIGALFCQ